MSLAAFLSAADSVVWGPVMIALLLGTHVYTTVRTGCIQRKLPLALRLSRAHDEGAEGDVSNFGAMATSLASTLGTGSIVGVATAVLSGGPGAVLWMWLTGILGMATKYTEVFASMKYRVRDAGGKMAGGAMYVWERRFARPDGSVPWWARACGLWFAIMAGFSIFGIGSAVQTSAITSVLQANFGWEPWIVALVVCASSFFIITGGLSKVASVCEKLVPLMGGAYVLGCVYILVVNHAYLLPALTTILECAFTPKAAFGGAVGSGVMVALQFGCARGLFSNESGLGTAPLIATAAASKNPARQALVSMTGTFWCTVVICLLSGLVIVSTLVANPTLVADAHVTDGAQLANAVFATIPHVGTPVLMLGIVCFAYSTIVGWSHYADRVSSYLFGKRWTKVYIAVYVLMGFLGGIGVGDVAWTATDIANALMALPNIGMVIACAGMVGRETRHYVYEGRIDEEAPESAPVVEDRGAFVRWRDAARAKGARDERRAGK